MCKIIDIKTRAYLATVATDGVSINTNTPRGMIDLYTTEVGKVGIDACVPAELATEMGVTETMPGMIQFNRGDNGLVAFDAHLLAAVAERLLAAAMRASIPIHR